MAETTENNEARSPRTRRDEICFWVVPGPSGKAKRVRCKIWLLLWLAGIVMFFVSGVGYVMTDYARAQYSRARSYFSLKIVEFERDRLLTKNNELNRKVKELQDEATRVANYEKNVKQRLEELASVVTSLRSLGVVTSDPQKQGDIVIDQGARASFSQEGVGGAEVDCEDSPGSCSPVELDPASVDARPDWALELIRPLSSLPSTGTASLLEHLRSSPPTSVAGPELISELDSYIETLKTVPFALPGNGSVSSGFGHRHSPFSGRVTKHEGIDLSLPQGAHVLATAEGVVKEVKYNPTYGLVIDIEHSDRVVTRYAHLRKAFVNEGERVCRGEVIGLVGNSGRSTGPHLHYEVRIDGEARNPEQLLALGERISSAF